MKKSFILPFILCFLITTISSGQSNKRDKFLYIVEQLFPHHEIDRIGSFEVIFTKVWDRPAWIEVDYCEISELENGIHAVAFTIFLSENPNDYKILIEEEFISMDEVEKDSEFTGGDQRLIQVVFYDFEQDKFLGKPEGFPISDLPWLPEEITIPLEYTWLESLKTSHNCSNTCVLTIAEYSNMYPEKLYYVFKYQRNKILSSGPFRGALTGLYEKGNMIFGQFEEYDDTGNIDEYEEPIMSF